MKRIIEMSAESFAEMELDRNEMLYFKNGCWFLKANNDLVAWRDADGKYWLVVNPDRGLARYPYGRSGKHVEQEGGNGNGNV